MKLNRFLLIIFLYILPIKTAPQTYIISECIRYIEQFVLNQRVIDLLFLLPEQSVLAKKTLLGLISKENKKISSAVFYLSDPDITDALEASKKRGIQIDFITDSQNITSQVLQLGKSSIPLFIYTPKNRMHHKTFIFHGLNIASIGSLNPTGMGFNGNAEYLILRNDLIFLERFKMEMEIIKKKSEQYIYTSQKNAGENLEEI